MVWAFFVRSFFFSQNILFLKMLTQAFGSKPPCNKIEHFTVKFCKLFYPLLIIVFLKEELAP